MIANSKKANVPHSDTDAVEVIQLQPNSLYGITSNITTTPNNVYGISEHIINTTPNIVYGTVQERQESIRDL